MPTFTYNIYAPSVLTFSGNTLTLSPSYSPTSNTTLVMTDNDEFFTGDSQNDENGDDNTQFGTATTASGTVLGGPTVKVYAEEHYTLSVPGQPAITVYRVEVDAPSGNGVLVGYLPSRPLEPGVTYTFTTTNTTNFNTPRFDALGGAMCLTEDALVTTADGERPAGQLVPGDLVLTRDHGCQAIRWIGRQAFGRADLVGNPKLCPVRIAAGALGHGLPQRDLLVSRQHRMLVSSRAARNLTRDTDLLVPAVKLVGIPGISVDHDAQRVTYIHLLFDRHEIIFSEGAPTESLFPGPEALKTLTYEALTEIRAIFPDLARSFTAVAPTLPFATPVTAMRLVERHRRTGRQLLESYKRTG